MNTATQLKALIRNIAKEKKVNAQVLLRHYMLERLLERISESKYRNNFILKGGLLISSMAGIDNRSTMDMDTTIKGIAVSKETIEMMIDEILGISINDNVNMKIKGIEDIREEADYSGFRVSIDTNFDGIRLNIKIDITTGDTITPREIEYKYNLMFEDRPIEVLAYNLETVLAEKLETIISRGTINTRMRDFYDIYILSKMPNDKINNTILNEAIVGTATKRGTLALFNDKRRIISEVKSSSIMQDLWAMYQKKYDYAADFTWDDVIWAVENVF
ncbi:MAG: nucleotidyl transferase AbiEii/AbiGii toxin family protein [Saccharofermentanales bacterium]